eukprot:scaffold3364_cov99-Skeletonema_dohrnii-CCMP3373.AAC.2
MDHSNVSSFTAPADECRVGEDSATRILSWPQELKLGSNEKVRTTDISGKFEVLENLKSERSQPGDHFYQFFH